MRFKRLRVAVGIAMIAFMLVAGGIIAFGLASGKSNGSGDLTLLAPIYNDNKVSQNQNTQPSYFGPTVQQPQPTIVYHRVVRTSAS